MLKALMASLISAVLMGAGTGAGTPSTGVGHFSTMSRLHESTLWQVAPAVPPVTVTMAAEVAIEQVQAQAPAETGLSPLPLPAISTTVAVHAPRVAAPPPPAPVCGIACFHALAPQSVRVIASAIHPARMGNGVTLIPIGSSVIVIGYVDNCNGRWYELNDHVSWVHESALAGTIAPPSVSC